MSPFGEICFWSTATWVPPPKVLLPTFTRMPLPSVSRQWWAVMTQRAAITVPEQLNPSNARPGVLT